MIIDQPFIKCIHEVPDYSGVFMVRLKDGVIQTANYNTHTRSFNVRGVVAWKHLDD